MKGRLQFKLNPHHELSIYIYECRLLLLSIQTSKLIIARKKSEHLQLQSNFDMMHTTQGRVNYEHALHNLN